MALIYCLLLPPTEAFAAPEAAYSTIPEEEDIDIDTAELDRAISIKSSSSEMIQALGTRAMAKGQTSLTPGDKMQLARPLVVKYMLPLFFVYLAGEFHPHRHHAIQS